MAPPIQYRARDIANAMLISRSMRQAAALVGMSLGAFRKRCLRDPLLRAQALACIERGKKHSGRRRV